MATNKMRTLYAMIKSQETKYQGQKGDINVRILEYEQEHEEIASEMQSEKSKISELTHLVDSSFKDSNFSLTL